MPGAVARPRCGDHRHVRPHLVDRLPRCRTRCRASPGATCFASRCRATSVGDPRQRGRLRRAKQSGRCCRSRPRVGAAMPPEVRQCRLSCLFVSARAGRLRCGRAGGLRQCARTRAAHDRRRPAGGGQGHRRHDQRRRSRRLCPRAGRHARSRTGAGGGLSPQQQRQLRRGRRVFRHAAVARRRQRPQQPFGRISDQPRAAEIESRRFRRGRRIVCRSAQGGAQGPRADAAAA